MPPNIILQKVKENQAKPDTIWHCLYGFYYLGYKKAALSKIYGKTKGTIAAWIKKFETTGTVQRHKVDEKRYKKLDATKRKWLIDLYTRRPILYQREAADLFFRQFSERISITSISKILREAGITWKTLERRAIQVQIDDVIRFTNELASINWFRHNLVFLDEVSFDNRCMLRKKGYSVKGRRLLYRSEFQRKARVSLLCFLGIDGIEEAYSTEGTFDRLQFIKFCRHFALNQCQRYPGNLSIWIMDGAAIHTDPNIVTYLRSLGIIVIFLPAYSPFYNPIEFVFGQIKKFLQSTHDEKSKEGIEHDIARAVVHFSSKNMKNLFKNCGYLYDGHFDPTKALEYKADDIGF